MTWLRSAASARSKPHPHRLVALLTPHHLRLLWLREGRPQGAGWRALEEGWLRGGELIEPRRLGQALGALLGELGFRGKGDLVWVVPPELMSVRLTRTPGLEGELLMKALEREVEALPPARTEAFVPRISLPEAVGGQALLGKVYEPTFKILARLAEERGLRLWDVEQHGVALAVRHAQRAVREGLWILLHLEPSASSLVVLWGGKLVRARTLVDLLDPWVRALRGEAGLLRVLLDEPERLEAAEVLAAIAAAVEETLLAVAQEGGPVELLKAAQEQRLSTIALAGSGALHEGLYQGLLESFGSFFAVERLGLEGAEGADLAPEALYSPLLGAVGERVSRFPLAGEKVDWSGRLRPALLIGLGVSAALLAGGWAYGQLLGQRVAALRAEAARLAPEEGRQRALEASVKALQQRLEALEGLRAVDWGEELEPLLRELPRGGEGLRAGLARLALLPDRDAYRYSLEGVAATREDLEAFLRRWEGEGRTVRLTRLERRGAVWAFVVTLEQRRDAGTPEVGHGD